MPILDNEQGASSDLSTQTVETLRSMAGWMRFVAFFFLVILSGALLGVLYQIQQTLQFYQQYGISIPLVAWPGALLAIGLVVAVLYFYAMLWRNANDFKRLSDQPNPEQLEQALRAQQRFWMLVFFFLVLALALALLYWGFLTSDLTRLF